MMLRQQQPKEQQQQHQHQLAAAAAAAGGMLHHNSNGYSSSSPSSPMAGVKRLRDGQFVGGCLGWGQGFTLRERIPSPLCVATGPLNLKDIGLATYAERNPTTVLYRDADGKPHFPMRVGKNLCLISTGVPPPDEKLGDFHCRDYVFFPGYVSVREHQSMVNPDHLCKYKCEVLVGERDNKPIFKVTCEDAPNEPISSTCADDVWQEVANEIYLVSNAPLSDRKQKINGYERFGFLNEAVIAITQETFGHLKCHLYEPIAVGATNFVY
eukprot:CAMPEP_0185279128 /NCGR_PEP_ID=MMETSP1359-20130426/62775_1 /TAXON_ID=552665 /ORGANISM="Bigelowiella longifila, Strain CCMP242" /LENGTH=267 /DNA_ID=CAMNT_0027873903 /DNA_START=1 /DNA_END=804 /DNA_ORIENTATION=+